MQNASKMGFEPFIATYNFYQALVREFFNAFQWDILMYIIDLYEAIIEGCHLDKGNVAMTTRFHFLNILLKAKNDIFSPDHHPLRLEEGLSVTNAVTVSATGRGITTADTGQPHTTGNLWVGGEIHTMTEETSNDWMTTTIKKWVLHSRPHNCAFNFRYSCSKSSIF